MSLWYVLAHQPTLFVITVFLLGLLVGSFLNVVIHRLPRMMEANFRAECEFLNQPTDTIPIEDSTKPPYNLITPRSCCPGCGSPIASYDNIPVLSWLLLKGKCRHCKTAISVRYPLVELGTGLLSAGIAAYFGWGFIAAGTIVFIWFLVALFWIDADTYLLPDDLTLPLLWLGLLFNLVGGLVSLSDALLGAVFGYLSLWSVYWLFKLVTGKEGMGYGDFKLLAAIGAWLGWQALPIVILLSSLVGAIIGITLTLLASRGWSKPLPFGPYLVLAGVIALIWGNDLQHLLWAI
ncbi:prepilin peptidase [Chitinimonas sp. BJB300]|uniref:prepilin peptidase n=1 Tax=Chitinimonas sp. BJB300 TaxID=1559339 RepID=UPI000C0EE20A|nr:A24 family peptidase [Chitinimonas sp. BJB300]PHV10347.1 prepilin peptidase [Chitinimonas sp. BJB300]TSJ90825.1 prepilin peptidase [Chitinimonas sp. BJB300]